MSKSKMRKVSSAVEQVIRAALYVRVSTDRQAEEGYSIEVQSERLSAYAKTFDGQVQTELYVDATVIIGLKQNPTHGRRFSPIFFA